MDDLIGYEEFYSIDHAGRVWSKRRLRFLTPHLTSLGWHRVHLSDSNGPKKQCVHQLVARQYLPNPSNSRCVRHLNDVKIDNRVGNLQWRIAKYPLKPKPKKQPPKPMPTNMKPLVGYEGLYSINREGQVWSHRKSRCLKQKQQQGYKQIRLSKNGCQSCYGIHRLLGLQLIPNPSNLPEVDHINRIRWDNRLSNLRWVTHQTNAMNMSISKANTSGVQGVRCRKSSGLYEARWTENSKCRGKSFKTLEEATAYRNLMIDLHYDRPELPPPLPLSCSARQHQNRT